MGFKRNFEDSIGNIYLESYWYPASIVIDKKSNSGSISFHGFKDQTARDTGKNHITERNYFVTGDLFSEYLTALFSGKENALSIAYRVALESKDVMDNSGNLISFFEYAEQI